LAQKRVRDIKFRVDVRFAGFWTNLRLNIAEFKSIRFLIYTLGWISFSFLLVAPIDFELVILFLIQGYFLFKLVGEVEGKLFPPSELLIIFFLLAFLGEVAILGSFYDSFAGLNEVTRIPFNFLTIGHAFLFSILIFIFSLLLVQNSGGKKWVICGYFLLGVISVDFIGSEEYYLIILQILLFFLLLRRTAWLEELTRIECWLYLLLMFFIFRGFSELKPFEGMTVSQLSGNEKLIWYQIPYFLYLLFQMYLLAAIVKIPFVLVYHHARLSRKLWIAGLFQSTFPNFLIDDDKRSIENPLITMFLVQYAAKKRNQFLQNKFYYLTIQNA